MYNTEWAECEAYSPVVGIGTLPPSFVADLATNPYLYFGRFICQLEPSRAVLWNRNRRSRNFLPCGTGTVTRSKVGTGTAINYGSGTVTRYKIMYLIIFSSNFFLSHCKINLLMFIIFFLVKQLSI